MPRESARPADRSHGGKYWVVQQHDQAEVKEGSERPDLSVEAGERMKRLYGPFATREEAKAKADALIQNGIAFKAGL
jgi:hypothetical protein